MSSLPAIITLSGLALFLYKQLAPIKAAPGEDFLIQDIQSNKITDKEVINAVQSGTMSHEGRINGSQYY